MKFKTLLLLIILEGLGCIAVLLIPASEPSSVFLFRYSIERLLLVLFVLIAIISIASLKVLLNEVKTLKDRLYAISIQFLGKKKYLISTFLLLTSGLFVITYLISILSIIDPLYQEIIFRILPIIIWLSLAGVQIAYYLFLWISQENASSGKSNIPLIPAINAIKTIGLEVLAIIILIGAQYQLIPKPYWEYRPIAVKYSPLIIFGLIVGSRIIGWSINRLQKNRALKIFLVGVLLIVLIGVGLFYYQAASKHSELNNAKLRADQSSYVHQTKRVYESGFTYTGNRIQMPIYLFLQAVFYDPDASALEAFRTGKTVNIYLSLFLLSILFLIFWFFLPLHKAMNLVLIVGFSSFIFKSAYFTTEILFYFISFIGFLLLCILFYKPNIWLGLATGAVLGIGHLTKASIFPGLIFFVVVYIIKTIFLWFSEQQKSKIYSNSLCLLFLVTAFFGTIFPYIHESKKEYGKWLYNAGYVVMWCESWEKALEIREKYNGWHNIPPHKAPGPLNYIQEHTFSHIVQRVKYGLGRQLENIRYQFNFFNYPVFFSIYLVYMFLVSIKKNIRLIKSNIFIIGFVFLYYLGYFMSFVWYSPIASLWRFIYGLHLPFMFVTFMSVHVINKESQLGKFKSIDLLTTLMLSFDIYYVLDEGLFLDNFAA